MKKICFAILSFVFVGLIAMCSDSTTSDTDAGPIKDAVSSICKSDNDCDKTAGQKCISSVCRIPDCLKDQDCVDKKKGDKCDLATYTCKTIANDAGIDILPDEGGTDCASSCDARCLPDKICKNGYCIPFGMCSNDLDCPCNWRCNAFESRCEECASDNDCANRQDGKTKCDIGKTFRCIEPPVCNPACDPNCQICKDGNCVLAPNKCCQNSDCPSNNCVNYECKGAHQCSDVCSTDQECKEWCNDGSYVCSNNICMPGSQSCQSNSDCDSLCGVGQGTCVNGSCQCNQCGGSGTMCSACNSDCDCDTVNGFVCYEFTNPLNGSTYKACTHQCTAREDCEAPAIMCLAGGGTLCSCLSAQ